MATTFPHLEMHQVFGKIAISTQKAYQEIRQPKATQTIRQPQAEMRVDRQPAHITIDQTEAWHNLDLKSAPVRNREAAQSARQAVMDGIARRAREGTELLHIEKSKGRNLFAKQAAANVEAAVIGTHFDTGHTPPFLAVKIGATPGRLNIDWQTHKPEINVTQNPPAFTYHPGHVNITMQQYPSLEIQAVGLYVDKKG